MDPVTADPDAQVVVLFEHFGCDTGPGRCDASHVSYFGCRHDTDHLLAADVVVLSKLYSALQFGELTDRIRLGRPGG